MILIDQVVISEVVMGAGELDQEALQNSIRDALTNWNKSGISQENLVTKLLLVQHELSDPTPVMDHMAINRAVYVMLQKAMQRLSDLDAVGAAVLQHRFIEGDITRRVATKMHASPDQVNRWQRSAISTLTQLIFNQEMILRRDFVDRLTSSLPLSPPVNLFGCDQALTLLHERLQSKGEPFLIALTGIGGIGKTSLANVLSRQIIPTLTFENVIWLQADRTFHKESVDSKEPNNRQLIFQLADQLQISISDAQSTQEILHQLHHVLNRKRSLVIIDDLETEAHTISALKAAEKLADPSKFILTTRARPFIDSPVFYFSVNELSYQDSRDLLIHHAQVLGTGAIFSAGEEVFSSIYETTGGNPLALKLVVGLASVLPLQQILCGLEESRPGPIESLYRHIYWEAWRTLSPGAQTLLQAMPLVSDMGGQPDQMRSISELEEIDFWTAVRELYSRSLLESHGPIETRRYSIHRLTDTFLRTEIIDWPLIDSENA